MSDAGVNSGLDEAVGVALADLLSRLRDLAGDSAYAAGRDYLRKGLVRHGTFDGTTGFATVAGSTDYTVSIALLPEQKSRCSCPAYRRNPYCKHVVAVVVGLSERPAAFRRVDPTPVPEPTAKAPRRKKAAADSREQEEQARTEQRTAGLETLDRLLCDLVDGGLVALTGERAAVIERVAATVRALKLRRLGNGVMALRRALPDGRKSVTAMSPAHFAALLFDLERTRQAVRAHLDGRIALDPVLAEELLGKTWREGELERIGGLDLLPLARESTSDGEFRVEADYLLDLATGTIYTEKQITPVALHARPSPPARHRLLVDEAAVYPGPTPRRLKLIRARRAPTHLADVDRALAHATAELDPIRRLLTERIAHPFVFPEFLVLLRPSALVTRAGAVALVDRSGSCLPVSWPEQWTVELPPLLPPPAHYGLVGFVGLGASGPRLRCVAIVGHLRWSAGPVYPDPRRA